MTEAERIEFIVQVLESGNGSAFGSKIGVSPATASKMRKGQVGFRLNKEAILSAYPQIRREWLETGEGYPGDLTVDLVRSYYEEKITKAERVIDHLMRRIDELEKRHPSAK
jgi:hypothetical protein